jgi:hypothetical protein
MHLSIIKEINQVIIEEKGLTVDCSSLPINFLSLHWVDTEGWVENKHNGRPAILDITDISEYQPLIESWREEKAKESKIVHHPGMKRHLVESLLDISLIRASDEWEEFKTATNRLGP